MANEIYQAYDSAKTLYAFIYRQSDKYIYDVGSAAFEAIGTWNDTRAGECDIAMTASGDMHFADFPVVAAGLYLVQIREQSTGSPDTDDTPLSHGFMVWDGTQEVTTQYITATSNSDITPLTQAVNSLASSSAIVQNTSDETQSRETVYAIKNL